MEVPLKATIIVSPASMAGEEKNQDRAVWHEPTATACVCDGVSSSPDSERAAEVGVQFSPVLFLGDLSNREDVFNRLGALCDLLIAKRMERGREAVAKRLHVATPMQRMLQQVAEEKLAQSYQTTFSAVHLLRHDTTISATVVSCGDASFSAFEADGVPLVTPVDSAPPSLQSKSNSTMLRRRAFYFGPGATLLVKIRGHAGGDRGLQRLAGIRAASATRWMVSEPLDQCAPANCGDGTIFPPGHLITPDDRLLIPSYLIGNTATRINEGYLELRYSRSVRVVKSTAPENSITQGRTNVTCVLPDHRGEKYWTYFQETFPADAHFVVASDGFTDCFSSPQESWQWLKQNEVSLLSPDRRQAVVQELHAHLQKVRGDDDISFVWIRPEL